MILPYEVHITVNMCDIIQFKEICKALEVKPILLDLVHHDKITPDLMTSSHFLGTDKSVLDYTHQLQIKLKDAGCVVLRSKIETVPSHPSAPQSDLDEIHANSYFESHIAIKSDSSQVRDIANKHGAKLSKNKMKKGNYSVQLLTIREYSHRMSFESKLKNFLLELDEYFIDYDKPIIEYALFDTNTKHDEEWMK